MAFYVEYDRGLGIREVVVDTDDDNECYDILERGININYCQVSKISKIEILNKESINT